MQIEQAVQAVQDENQLAAAHDNTYRCFELCKLLVEELVDFACAALILKKLPEYGRNVMFELLALAKKRAWPKLSKSKAEAIEADFWQALGPTAIGKNFSSIPD